MTGRSKLDPKPGSLGLTVKNFEAFYKTTSGNYLSNEIENLLIRSWSEADIARCHTLCLGYPPPGLKAVSSKAASFALFTPAFLGPKKMIKNGKSYSAMGDETHLPLHPGSYDRALIFHALEYMEDPVSFLEEVWKVLSPGGRVFMMVPNKKGAWKKSGIPTTAATKGFLFREIKTLLMEKGFTITGNFGASYGLPVDFFGTVLFSGLLKTLSGGGSVGFPGFLIFEAEKHTTPATCRPTPAYRTSPAKPVVS